MMKTKMALNLTLFAVVFIFGLIFASGCGIKGDPLPSFEQQTIQTAPQAEKVVPKKALKKAK